MKPTFTRLYDGPVLASGGRLDMTEKTVLAALERYIESFAGRVECAAPEWLARVLDEPQRNVERVLASLRAKGAVKVDRQGRRAAYSITVERPGLDRDDLFRPGTKRPRRAAGSGGTDEGARAAGCGGTAAGLAPPDAAALDAFCTAGSGGADEPPVPPEVAVHVPPDVAVRSDIAPSSVVREFGEENSSSSAQARASSPDSEPESEYGRRLGEFWRSWRMRYLEHRQVYPSDGERDAKPKCVEVIAAQAAIDGDPFERVVDDVLDAYWRDPWVLDPKNHPSLGNLLRGLTRLLEGRKSGKAGSLVRARAASGRPSTVEEHLAAASNGALRLKSRVHTDA